MTNRNAWFLVFILILGLLLSFPISGFSELAEQPIDRSTPDLSEPRQSFVSARLERLGSGVANVVYGPLELPYQIKEEIKRTDPIQGSLPGLLRGLGWFGAREGVGLFEIVTFLVPLKPHLKPFDTGWLQV